MPQAADFLQDMVGPLDELLPLRGQGDAVVPPVQQQVPKAVLQIVDDLAQIGLGDKERLGGLVDGMEPSWATFKKYSRCLTLRSRLISQLPP